MDAPTTQDNPVADLGSVAKDTAFRAGRPTTAEQQFIKLSEKPSLKVRRHYVPVPRLDLAIRALNCLIKNKVSWYKKVEDDAIAAKWKQEIEAQILNREEVNEFDKDLWVERLNEMARELDWQNVEYPPSRQSIRRFSS